MHWFFILFFCCSAFYNASEAMHDQRKLPSAVIVGTVYCDTCFQDDFSWNSHFISGASVEVECKDRNSTASFRQEVKTDKHGEFKVELPLSVSKHVRKIKRCSVKLLSSNEPNCAVASTATSSSIRLKSRKQGMHIFSAGFFSFKPEKQPILCNQKPSIHNSKDLNAQKESFPTLPPFTNPAFPPPLQDPPTPELPPLNQNHLPPLPLLPKLPPLPELPPLPGLPGLPVLPPIPGKTKKAETVESLKKEQLLSDRKSLNSDFFLPTPPVFPPNPLQPPSVFPLNPFQPPPLFPPIPNPLQPPPAPLIPLPRIPFLTPPPPPPPPPPLIPNLPPFPFPPFPFPPRSPGVPPASSSQKASP